MSSSTLLVLMFLLLLVSLPVVAGVLVYTVDCVSVVGRVDCIVNAGVDVCVACDYVVAIDIIYIDIVVVVVVCYCDVAVVGVVNVVADAVAVVGWRSLCCRCLYCCCL